MAEWAMPWAFTDRLKIRDAASAFVASRAAERAYERKLRSVAERVRTTLATTKPEQAEKAMQTAFEQLNTPFGVEIMAPCYKQHAFDGANMLLFNPTTKENGGIFCQIQGWAILAEALLGHGDRAFAVYRKTCPAYIEDISEIHRTEPYVYSQMVAGKDAPTFGEAKNSWLTGTAAWTFFNISQYILGIQPTLDGLRVDPCIPHTLTGYTVTRRFRGAEYRITVDNAAGVQHGVKAVTVDGKAICGNVLPLAAAGTEVTVQVTMG